jgi:glycosyltransferase involved in cell wall biosynthesis
LDLSVVVSTYNQPRLLELVLWGYAAQTLRGFEVVVADDGSAPETRRLVERMRSEAGLRITHVWHPDRGFRKCEILNRAILAASGDYLVFTDGDTVPRADFLATHARLARPDTYLAGAYVKLPRGVSAAVTPADVTSGRATSARWLRSRGWKPGYRALRLTRWAALAGLCDRAATTPVRWRGSNSSTWKHLLLEVDGFDMEMGYGDEDAALGDRLENLGVRPRRIRYSAAAVHLWHEAPWHDHASIRANGLVRQRIRRTGETRAVRGISQLAEPFDGSTGPRPARAASHGPSSAARP